MKITVLTDNNTLIDRYYLGEPALSFLIEDEDETILFDTGYSDVFLRNAEKMGISTDRISKVVISHGHDDHTGGLRYLLKERTNIELIAHPDAFNYREDDNGLPICSPFRKKQLEEKCQLTLTSQPLRVSRNLTFLGQIPRVTDFEICHPLGNTVTDGRLQPDYFYDDSALVYQGNDGLFIITACSHSGICNIIEQAIATCHDDRITGIIGGFHLFDADERLSRTIEYLSNRKVRDIYPCHCVSLQAKIKMAEKLTIHEVGVSTQIEIA